jgi:hypothetical protein
MATMNFKEHDVGRPDWLADAKRCHPAWRYPAASFHDMFGGRSIEDWLAYEDCHARIVAGDRDGLTARALKSPGGRGLTIEYCRDLHERFWRARRGVQDRGVTEGEMSVDS